MEVTTVVRVKSGWVVRDARGTQVGPMFPVQDAATEFAGRAATFAFVKAAAR